VDPRVRESSATPAATTPTLATVVIGPRAVARVRGGHPWVRREDVRRGPEWRGGSRGEAGAGSADVVRLIDERGRPIATALWSAAAPIAARVLDRDRDVRLDADLIGARLDAALARRRALFGEADAFRVVHGEADLLPGLFVDRYADVAVVQTACAALDARESLVADLVAARLGARLVVARDDGSARDLEGLPRRKRILRGEGPTRVRFHDAGSLCEADVMEDGKTGAFLDQQENHARAASYVVPGVEALDAFTYHGGFALALARAGARVLALDESAAAVERARANAVLSGVSAALEVRQANAFDALRELEASGRRFDLVVIDPPALAKRRSALVAAERAYKELDLRGLRLVRPGGVLVTCSCSGRLTAARFGEIVEDAAADVGRPVQLLERRGAGRDHPPLIGVPETEYLKCWILRVLA
jgi:23S rRNA (cytosine1962-C5)-methyltransferase